MNAKKTVLVAALTALPLAIASANAQTQSNEMVIATQLPEDMSNNAIYPALVHFKNLVEARTDGDLEVTIFGGGQLGSEVENGSEVQGGRTLQSTIMSALPMVSSMRRCSTPPSTSMRSPTTPRSPAMCTTALPGWSASRGTNRYPKTSSRC